MEHVWETLKVDEARVHYSFWVSKGTITTLNSPEYIASAVRDVENQTMGRVNVDMVETRIRVINTTEWKPVASA
jgi:hypothetical protein